MLGRPSKVISSSMNAFLGIWDMGVCPKGSYSTGQTFWPVDGATVIAGGHQYCWLSSPSKTHRRQGFSPFVQSGRAMKLALNFCYFWAEASKSQQANLPYPFPCLGAPLKLHADMGAMRSKQSGEVEGNCPGESPGPTEDFV